jgi:HlyD family secretion protein
VSKHRKVGLALGFLALLVTAGWGSRGYFWGPQNGAKYRTAAVERRDIAAYVSATGTLTPVIMVQVGTQVFGTIEKLFAIARQDSPDSVG